MDLGSCLSTLFEHLALLQMDVADNDLNLPALGTMNACMFQMFHHLDSKKKKGFVSIKHPICFLNNIAPFRIEMNLVTMF